MDQFLRNKTHDKKAFRTMLESVCLNILKEIQD